MSFRALTPSRSRICNRLIRCRAPIFRRQLSSQANSSFSKPRPDKILAQAGFSEAEWADLKSQFSFPQATPSDALNLESVVTIHGFLQRRRDMSSKRTFVDVKFPGSPINLQLLSQWEIEDSPEHKMHAHLKSIPPYSAVAVTGKVVEKTTGGATDAETISKVLIAPSDIRVLNAFPKDITVKPGTVYPPSDRHLQLRFGEALPRRIAFRAKVAAAARRHLDDNGLMEVETPLLFKSTPEGAREFLVPTRQLGKVYALPQSPQQFKQILMCAGMAGYYQLARCFRDEDLRADRQPEFTQLDLEKSFATGEDVMRLVEGLMRELWGMAREKFVRGFMDGEAVPFLKGERLPKGVKPEILEFPDLGTESFQRITYDEAMSLYGSDKPDLRIPNAIQRIEHILPSHAISKISSIPSPVIDACRFRLDGDSSTITSFVDTFCSALDANLPADVARNSHGLPAILPYTPTKPLGGLSFLGHEAVETLTSEESSLPHLTPLEPSDVLILQARPDSPFTGGSTALGTIRAEFYRQAVAAGLLPRDNSFRFLWVTGFPMFTATDPTATEPGQGGSAGFSSTHHPFTAPLTPADTDLLQTDPLAARADHYDLVVNGVELGGGSRRIHNAGLQRYVFEKILGMDESRVKQFRHLLGALRAGCPPHAGFALGFDRLVAVMGGTGSVRDVIAFPKNMNGADVAVGSPANVTTAELAVYGMEFRKKKKEEVPRSGIGW